MIWQDVCLTKTGPTKVNFQELNDLNNLALREAKKYPVKRFLFDGLYQKAGKHFIGIIGPRGVGKTILLKQLTNAYKNAFYISLDSIVETDLFETVKSLSENYAIKVFMLDEIHFYNNYQRDLKKIYDFLDVKIFFTSSAALAIQDARYDLSRRVNLISLYPFSFREYIYFKENIELPKLTFDNIIDKKWEPGHFRLSHLFDGYLKGGLFPFALEEPDVFGLLKNIIQKILYRDIPQVSNLRVLEIQIIEKLISFIGKSSVDGINYSTVSKNLAITKYKAEHYIKLLSDAFILNVVFPAGTNVLKEPKVVMNLPYRLLYNSWEEAVGGIREDFFVETMQMHEYTLSYLKSTRGTKTPDYLINKGPSEMIIEIGGKGKGRQQFKGIDRKKSLIFTHSDVVDGMKRPLFLLGYL